MNNFFTFERTMFRRDAYGELLFFGFPLFGGWLPFVGFRKEGILKNFDVEWFLRGIRFVYSVDFDMLDAELDKFEKKSREKNDRELKKK